MTNEYFTPSPSNDLLVVLTPPPVPTYEQLKEEMKSFVGHPLYTHAKDSNTWHCRFCHLVFLGASTKLLAHVEKVHQLVNKVYVENFKKTPVKIDPVEEKPKRISYWFS